MLAASLTVTAAIQHVSAVLLGVAVVIGLTYIYVRMREEIIELRSMTADERKKRKNEDQIFHQWYVEFKKTPSTLRDGTKR